MKNLLVKIFIIISITIVYSCAKYDDNKPVKIRVVNLQGNAKPVDIKTPDLNIKALQEQGRTTSQYFQIAQRNNQNQIPAQEQGRNSPSFSNSFYENKYNNQTPKESQQYQNQEIIYQNPNPQNNAKANARDVKYVLDTKNNVKENPIIVNDNKIKDSALNVEKEVEFNLAGDESSAKKTKKTFKIKKPKTQKSSITKSGYFVQVGAFKNRNNANKSLNYMKKFHSGRVQYKKNKANINYRVILGPFSKRASAQQLYNKVKKSGSDALIIKTKY